MRFIPTKFHAPLDYIVGVALIAAPWIFQFSEHTSATGFRSSSESGSSPTACSRTTSSASGRSPRWRSTT